MTTAKHETNPHARGTPAEGEEKKPEEKKLSKPDFSDPDNPKWGATVAELADLLQKEFTPIETCERLREWAGEDDKLTVDAAMEKLFRLHPSYDGTIRKAYTILSGNDKKVLANAMKKIYDKVAADTPIDQIMGVTRVL